MQKSYDALGIKSTKPKSKREVINMITELRRLAYPSHWREAEHENDGVDKRWKGRRPKEGTKGERLLRGEINKLMQKGGVWTAWDDVAMVQLNPQKVLDARMDELKYGTSGGSKASRH